VNLAQSSLTPAIPVMAVVFLSFIIIGMALGPGGFRTVAVP
jgi:hypothetical protein